MLTELAVRNFAVIEETRLSLGAGLNVVTGETGAGKSLLVDALSFVLGGPVDRGVIRAGAATASVDAVFRLPSSLTELRAALAEVGHEPDEDGTLVLSRETHREGNTVSRLNGRAVPVRVAREVGERLVDIHGQGQHLALFDSGFQLAVLDAFGGLQAKRDGVARAVAEVRRVEAEMSRVVSDAHRVAERSDLLRFQAGEIRAADLKPGEEAALTEERDVLANARAVQEACAAAYELLYDAGSNASDLLAQAVQALRRALGPLRTLAPSIDALEQSAAQIEDAAREIRGYAESLESDPARLGEIEDRLELVRRLKRKYGGGEEATLAFAADAERQLAEVEHADDRRIELEAGLDEARLRAGGLAWELSQRRRDAAAALDGETAAQLADLDLGRVRFTTEVAQTPDGDGLPWGPGPERYAFTADGVDRVEFRVETNPGEGAKPLDRVASGGETSRIMLAVTVALHGAAPTPTVAFDEIDAGIGARAGEVVGRKLWLLARDAQVLCVTHLPQIAAFADRHFRVEKAELDARTYASAAQLGDDARLGEIAEMLGGRRSSELDAAAARMLDAAQAAKQAASSHSPEAERRG